ncbi:MAG: LacI family DNA-binding transcriptional regulator, partial [Terriglobia bacterium]
IQGAYEMTRYLQRLQHRNIWFVGNTAEPWSHRCFHGYERAMKEMGLPSRVSSLESSDSKEAGYLGTKSLLGRGEIVTAIVGATDETAQGIYKALREQGLQIPGDISVAGCNDTFGSLLSPTLTTIREFPEQLGRRMVELVLNRSDQPDLGPQQVTVPTELVKRESCDKCQLNSTQERAHSMASAIT